MLSTIPSASWKERPTTKTYQNNLRKSCGICLVQLVQKLGMVQTITCWCSTLNTVLYSDHLMGLNGCGTPKSSILIGFSIINHPFWGAPIFGNTQMVIHSHPPITISIAPRKYSMPGKPRFPSLPNTCSGLVFGVEFWGVQSYLLMFGVWEKTRAIEKKETS